MRVGSITKKKRQSTGSEFRPIFRVITVVLITVLLLNMVFLAMGKISDILFWIIILLAGLSSFIISKVR